jgi:hypothetical protein
LTFVFSNRKAAIQPDNTTKTHQLRAVTLNPGSGLEKTGVRPWFDYSG